MGRWIKIILVVFLVGSASWRCSEKHQPIVGYTPTTTNDGGLTLEQIEQKVRAEYDYKAIYTFSYYDTLLQELSKPAYHVLALNEFRQNYDDSKILVGMRHDIDGHPFKALTLARMENQYGLHASYYILHSAIYYGEFTPKGVKRYQAMNTVYQTLTQLGHEIGVHNDLLSLMILYQIDPLTFELDELAYYQRLQIPIFGTAAHGSSIAIEAKIFNYNIFSDFSQDSTFLYRGMTYCYGKPYTANSDPTQSVIASTDTSKNDPKQQVIFKKLGLRDFGFEYEAYHISYNKYLSDSGGRWNGGRVKDPILFLQACKPGDRVQVLTHPLWWGRQNQSPVNIAKVKPTEYNAFEID